MVEEGKPIMALGEYATGDAVVFEDMLERVMALGGDMAIVMHSEVEYIKPTLGVMKDKGYGALGAYAHSGTWDRPNWNFESVISPGDYLEAARGWVDSGARLIGGCCGVGPEHIRLLSENVSRGPAKN